MNQQSKIARSILRSMPTKRARVVLEEIGLPAPEFKAIYFADIEQRPLAVIADEMAISERTLKRLRKQAYKRINGTLSTL